MPKSPQVLMLDPPNELKFKGPFTAVVTSYLTLKNPSDRRVCFKVKTTAPKKYCVRPNSGILEPKEDVPVAVMLQPFDIYDLKQNDKHKHKFMVQTMFAPDEDFDQDSLWKNVDPDELMDSKLKCVFDMSGEPDQANKVDANPPNVPDVEKDKIKSEPLKLSPKVIVSDPDMEGKKSKDEIKQLRDAMVALRKENFALKEEGLRQRRHISDSSATGHASGLPTITQVGPCQQYIMGLPPLTYLAILIVALLMGIIMGKFFL